MSSILNLFNSILVELGLGTFVIVEYSLFSLFVFEVDDGEITVEGSNL